MTIFILQSKLGDCMAYNPEVNEAFNLAINDKIEVNGNIWTICDIIIWTK